MFEEEDLLNMFEETFDTCTSNKEELFWLVSMINGLMNIPTRHTSPSNIAIKMNYFQYWLYPIIERYKKKWHHSTRKGKLEKQ